MTTPGSDPLNAIEAPALAEWLGRQAPVTVLDVRRPERWSEDPERIPGAVWIPHDEVQRRAQDLPADRDVVIYCS